MNKGYFGMYVGEVGVVGGFFFELCGTIITSLRYSKLSLSILLPYLMYASMKLTASSQSLLLS